SAGIDDQIVRALLDREMSLVAMLVILENRSARKAHPYSVRSPIGARVYWSGEFRLVRKRKRAGPRLVVRPRPIHRLADIGEQLARVGCHRMIGLVLDECMHRSAQRY